MPDQEIDRALTEALLAYFRPGGRFTPLQPPAMNFPESRRLLRLHWAFSPGMCSLFDHLLRRHGEIVSRSAIGIEQTMGSIRGSGLWPQTYVQRQVAANPALVIYRDVRRTYEVGPNRVLLFVIVQALRSLEPYADRTELAGTPYGVAIREAFNLAIRSRRVMEIRQIASPLAGGVAPEPSIQDLRQASMSRRRLYRLAADLYQIYRNISRGKVDSLREVLSKTLIAPLFAWQRFELFTVLRLGLAIHRSTGLPAHLNDLTGAMREPAITAGPFAIYWGVRPPGASLPGPLPAERQQVEDILRRFGLSPRTGRSDIAVVDSRQQNVVAIIECKYGADEAGDPGRQFREAVHQVVQYVQDYGGDVAERLTRSAIVMRRLPAEVSEHGGIAGPGDPIAMSASDLLHGSPSLREWVLRLSAR